METLIQFFKLYKAVYLKNKFLYNYLSWGQMFFVGNLDPLSEKKIHDVTIVLNLQLSSGKIFFPFCSSIWSSPSVTNYKTKPQVCHGNVSSTRDE